MSESGSSVISRLIDRMSPSRDGIKIERGLTEEQEGELGHIFKVRESCSGADLFCTANPPIQLLSLFSCVHW